MKKLIDKILRIIGIRKDDIHIEWRDYRDDIAYDIFNVLRRFENCSNEDKDYILNELYKITCCYYQGQREAWKDDEEKRDVNFRNVASLVQHVIESIKEEKDV